MSIVELLKAEVKRGNIRICRADNDIIIYDVASKEFMIFNWENIDVISSLNNI